MYCTTVHNVVYKTLNTALMKPTNCFHDSMRSANICIDLMRPLSPFELENPDSNYFFRFFFANVSFVVYGTSEWPTCQKAVDSDCFQMRSMKKASKAKSDLRTEVIRGNRRSPKKRRSQDAGAHPHWVPKLNEELRQELTMMMTVHRKMSSSWQACNFSQMLFLENLLKWRIISYKFEISEDIYQYDSG